MSQLREKSFPLCFCQKETSLAFKKQEENLKNCEWNRRMDLQTDLKTAKRDQDISKAVSLQWRWQEICERERQAQQHNRQLLQEFERAQDTLRDMVKRTAAMHTIRVEYEHYLEESFPHWVQQLKEKTLSVQRQRLEGHLKECLKQMEEVVVSTSTNGAQPILSQANDQRSQDVALPVGYSNQNGHQIINQNDYEHTQIPFIRSSRLTHTLSPLARSTTRLPSHCQGSAHISQAPHPSYLFNFLYPHQPPPFKPPHSFIPSQPYSQRLPLWASHTDSPPPWTNGVSHGAPQATIASQARWNHTPMPGIPTQVLAQTMEMEICEGNHGGPSAERSNSVSHELDTKPVRLSGGHSDSSENGRASSQASVESDRREKRKRKEKKGGSTDQSWTDRNMTSSQRSSRGSNVVAEPSGSVASLGHSSGCESSRSESRSSRKSRGGGGLSVKPPKKEEESHRTRIKRIAGLGSRSEEPFSQIAESVTDKSVSEQEDKVSHIEQSESQIKESLCGLGTSQSAVEELVCRQGESESHAEETESQIEASGSVSMNFEEDCGENDSEGSVKERETDEKDGDKGEDDEDDENEDNVGLEREKEEPETGSECNDSPEEEPVDEGEDDNENDSKENHKGKEEDEGGLDGEMATDSKREMGGSSVTSQDGEMEGTDGEETEEGLQGEEDEEEEHSTGENDSKEDEAEEEGERITEEAQEEPEEERDSDDSIISPAEHRLKRKPLTMAGDEEAIKDDSVKGHEGDGGDDEVAEAVQGHSWSAEASHEFIDEDDEIESLLAPQMEERKKEENNLKESVNPTVDEQNALFEEEEKTKDLQDSADEFDHFYD